MSVTCNIITNNRSVEADVEYEMLRLYARSNVFQREFTFVLIG